MEPFATAEAVTNRLEFEVDEDEIRAIKSALEDMSEEARFIAGREWPEPEAVPYMVRVQVVKAVTRWARNMQGLIESRAANETLKWPDLGSDAPTPFFTDKEKAIIKAIGDGRTGGDFFGTVEVVAYGSRRANNDNGYRNTVGGGNKPFPFDLPDGQVW